MREAEIEKYIPEYVGEICRRFWSVGEEAYLVGGSLRDIMLGRAPSDFDLTASTAPERTMELFADKRVVPTGIKHGTVTVIYDGEPVEITTFRIDGSYTDSRHPDAVSFTSRVEEDLARRDFTVNAMAYNSRRGLVDPFGGEADLRAGVIRAVGDSRRRFAEDALRIMRAFRFSAQLGFSVDTATLSGARECMGGLSHIARERIGAEFIKLVTSQEPMGALELMAETGAMPYVLGSYLPRGELMAGLSKMPREDGARLGFLLCDAEESEAQKILRGLKCSNAQITAALAVIRGARLKIESPADGRRLIGACGAHAKGAVTASVILGNSPAEAIAWVAENTSACTIGDLAVSGRELMEIGIEGREIGKTLERLLSEVIADPRLNTKETMVKLARQFQMQNAECKMQN